MKTKKHRKGRKVFKWSYLFYGIAAIAFLSTLGLAGSTDLELIQIPWKRMLVLLAAFVLSLIVAVYFEFVESKKIRRLEKQSEKRLKLREGLNDLIIDGVCSVYEL
ncbi:MAG: hypothetical protein IJ341_02110 [Bacteroidales bacterium]|nr:hypothetical protein [Bacteroidales bacterium]